MHILITGGAGFIGSHLAEYHLNRGDTVLTVDDMSTGSEGNLATFMNERCESVHADLLTWNDLGREAARADRIYHMAAVVGMFRVLDQPIEVTRVNVLGTERLLECVASTERLPELMIASSSSVYGYSRERELVERNELIFAPGNTGLTAYALSKLTNEIQAMAYRKIHGIPVSIGRLFNAVGPRQSGNYGFVLPRFIRQALSGNPHTVFGDGTQTRAFCDVRDTIKALDLLAGNPLAWGKIVNVGNPREIAILDLAKLVIERSGSLSSIEFIPFEQGYGESFHHITQRRPSIGLLQELTSFSPALTLEQTIDDLIEHNQPHIVDQAKIR